MVSIREFYLGNKDDRTLFPVELKTSDSMDETNPIQVDLITLARRSPILLQMTEDLLGESASVILTIDSAVIHHDLLKQIVLSWYDCDEPPVPTFEVLRAVDWLGDVTMKNACTERLLVEMKQLYKQDDLLDFLKSAMRYNCDDVAHECQKKLAWSQELIQTLEEFGRFCKYQTDYVRSYDFCNPVSKCLENLVHPPIDDGDELQTNLVRLFVRPRDRYPHDLNFSKSLMAYHILHDCTSGALRRAIQTAHPKVIELLKNGLKNAIPECIDGKEIT